MHILILTPFYYNVGGAESFTKDLIKEVRKHHEITLCTLKPRRKAWKGTGLYNLFSVLPILILNAFLKVLRKKPNIIHAQGLISGLVAVLLKKIFKVKVFITLLALYEFEKQSTIFKAVSRFIFKNCDLVFVEGEGGRRDLNGLWKHIPKDFWQCNVRLFNHWVDQDKFKPPERPRERDKIRVLFIGRPIPEKGLHIVEDAERILNDKERYAFRYITEAPLEELPAHYQWADILCVPSLYAEGYVRVVAEGASCGCAIIVSNKGSLPEMIKGWAISEEPTGELFAYQIQKVHLDTAGKQAYDYSQKNFNSKNANVFLQEYK